MTQKRYAQNAFTLIELIIVVIIIGILASVLITIINPRKQQNIAYDAVLKSSMNKLALEVQSFVSTTGAYPDSSTFVNLVNDELISQQNGDGCTSAETPNDECKFRLNTVTESYTCNTEGWTGQEGDNELCHFRYKGGINGEKDRFRIYVKSLGRADTLFVYDNKEGGQIRHCPLSLTDEEGLDTCGRVTIVVGEGGNPSNGGGSGGSGSGGSGGGSTTCPLLGTTNLCETDLPDVNPTRPIGETTPLSGTIKIKTVFKDRVTGMPIQGVSIVLANNSTAQITKGPTELGEFEYEVPAEIDEGSSNKTLYTRHPNYIDASIYVYYDAVGQGFYIEKYTFDCVHRSFIKIDSNNMDIGDIYLWPAINAKVITSEDIYVEYWWLPDAIHTWHFPHSWDYPIISRALVVPLNYPLRINIIDDERVLRYPNIVAQADVIYDACNGTGNTLLINYQSGEMTFEKE